MPLTQGYEISTDPGRIDIDYVHSYLSEVSYWAKGIPRDVVARSIANSIVLAYMDPTASKLVLPALSLIAPPSLGSQMFSSNPTCRGAALAKA